MNRARFGLTGTSVLALCAASALGTSAFAADLPEPHYTYKDDTPAIVGFHNWAGFYAGGHLGGGWRNGDSRNLTVRGGDGGGGGGGGGDNNWRNNPTDAALKDGAPGQSGNAGGAGGRGGNQTVAFPGGTSFPERRIGGSGGDGGAGGVVSSEIDDDDTFVGGVHLGYNWQSGSLVLGVEGDASFDGGLDNYLATLRGRLGLARNDTLFYVTGGLAFRDGDAGAGAIGIASNGGAGGAGGQNDDGIDDGEAGQAAANGGLGGAGGAGGTASASGFNGNGGDSETGFVVGGGVEYMLSGNVSAGFEGLWYSFDDNEDLTILRARLTLHLDRSPHQSFKDGRYSAAIANWSGFYAGAHAGVGFGDGKRADTVARAAGDGGEGGDGGARGNTALNGGGNPISDGIDDPGGGGGGGGGGAAALIALEDDGGVLGGVHLGYNWQSGSKVFGIEADADLADDSFREYLASVRLRLGHAFDRVLVYGTAGVAFAGTPDGIASVAVTPGGAGGNGTAGQQENDPRFGGGVGGAGGAGGSTFTTERDGDDKVGFVVGGGFEVKLTDSTSLGVEGLYYGFDGDDAFSTSTLFEAGDDASTAVVRGRLTFQLDKGHEALK